MREVVKAGEIKPIQISTADRGGRKHVTSVVGVESFALDAEELAGLLQRKLAAACSVQALPGKDNKGKEKLLVQGEVGKKVSSFLQEVFGVPSALINIAK